MSRDDYRTCPHCWNHLGNRKRLFLSRKDARKARRRMSDRWMYIYECPHLAQHWHIGHAPGVVRRGEATRHEAYRA